MPKKKTTIEDLAILVKRGFDQIATKDELHKEIGGVKDELHKEIGGVKGELKDLKEHVMRLSLDVSKLKEEARRDDPYVDDLLRRMRVVEKRVGVVK